MPVVKQIKVYGLKGGVSVVDVIKHHVKPAVQDENHVNIAPAVAVWFGGTRYKRSLLL